MLDNMEPTILYPVGENQAERIALLTGIVQLVSAALTRSGTDACEPHFMKSDRGVIGYCQMEPFLIICEGDNERETEEALKAVTSSAGASDAEITSKLDSHLKRTGREIGDLWR
jgi:hypothetical protein